ELKWIIIDGDDVSAGRQAEEAINAAIIGVHWRIASGEPFFNSPGNGAHIGGSDWLAALIGHLAGNDAAFRHRDRDRIAWLITAIFQAAGRNRCAHMT